MAHVVKKDYGDHQTVASKLQDLLNGSTITTLHGCGIEKVGSDFFICWIAYEGT